MASAQAPATFIPTWQESKALAKKCAKDLKLDYYDDPERMTLLDVLHLIRTKIVLGTGMPPEVKSPPWRVPPEVTDSKVINEILEQSMKVQMAVIPGSEFREFILSNACLGVSGLLRLYLKSLGVKNVEIVSGILAFSTKPGADGTPHVWLEVDGHPMDNTFVHFPADKGPQSLLFRMKQKDLYVKEDPNATGRKLYFGKDEFVEKVISPVDLNMFNVYGSERQIEKCLVSMLRTAPMNPCVKMYDIAMRDYLLRAKGHVVEDLEEKWDRTCWSCFRSHEAGAENKFKACSVCKMAKYCDAKCQKKDWKIHKILHGEIANYLQCIQ